MLSLLFGEQFDNLRHILEFYLSEGSKILDITYGRGGLWQSVKKATPQIFQLTTNDIDLDSPAQHHYYFNDLLKIPIRDFDAVVYDPPYLYGRESFKLHNRPNEAWTTNKTKWTVDLQVACAQELNKVLPHLLKKDGFLVVKIMDSRFKGQLVLNHKIIIDELTNFQIRDIIIYARLGVGVFKNKKTPQTAHGFYLIFVLRVPPKGREK